MRAIQETMQHLSPMPLAPWFALVTLAAVSCSSASPTPSVEFHTGGPVGLWPIETSLVAGATASTPNAVAGNPSPPPIAATSGVGATQITAGKPGTIDDSVKSTAAGAGASNVAGGSAGIPAGSAGAAGGGGTMSPVDAGLPETSAVATSLTFDVTTSPVGGRYQPRNIGAIWIQDSQGKLVKSLEVWAAIRRRYLTKYVSALKSTAVDVTSSATLSSHRTHHAKWNMVDRNGGAIMPGKYTLVIELTDGDMTGRSTTVDFDTSGGAQTLTPTDVPSFGAMKLQLQ